MSRQYRFDQGFGPGQITEGLGHLRQAGGNYRPGHDGHHAAQEDSGYPPKYYYLCFPLEQLSISKSIKGKLTGLTARGFHGKLHENAHSGSIHEWKLAKKLYVHNLSLYISL